MARKKNNGAGPIVAEAPVVAAEDKLKEIRAARRLVKKKEIDLSRLSEEKKLAKEELDAAVADLCRIIDGSPQMELFVGHANRKTGEVESDES